jgi:alanine racemase
MDENLWLRKPTKVATIPIGYADGILEVGEIVDL